MRSQIRTGRGARCAASLVLFAGSILAAAAPAAAAPAPTPAATDTPVVANPFTVTVTAARQSIPLRLSPAATTVLGAAPLARVPRGAALDEALFTIPGVRVDNQADGERVHLSIRGQGILTERGIRGIKVLMDGLPLNDPSGIAPDLYDVDWSTVSRLELLRGPAAAFYGGGGTGGVLSLSTRDGAAPGGEASFTGGDYGYWKALGEARALSGTTEARTSFSRVAGDGWRQHTAFRGENAYGKVRWTPNARVEITQVLSWTSYFDENAEGLNALQLQQDPRQANPDAYTYDEYYRTDRIGAGVVGHVALTSASALQLSAWMRSTRYRAAVPSAVTRRGLATPGLTAQLDHHAGAGALRNHLSVGGEGQWQGIDESRYANLGAAREGGLLANQEIQQRGLGAFAIDRVELGPQWSLLLSGRYDANDNRLTDRMASDTLDLSGRADFRRATARAGLAWTPSPKLSLYANAGQGFLPPATEELANNPGHQGGFNRALEPATSLGEELGVRAFAPGRIACDVAVFHLHTDHDFDRYRIPSRPLETFYRNLGESRRYGLETRLEAHLPAGFSSVVAWTWSGFHYLAPDSIDGHGLPNSPRQQLDTEVAWARGGTSAAVSCQAQSDWWIDPTNRVAAPGFTLWGARVAQSFRRGAWGSEVSLAARNLFSQRWLAFTEPDPDGNSYQPGPPRELFVRVTVMPALPGEGAAR